MAWPGGGPIPGAAVRYSHLFARGRTTCLIGGFPSSVSCRGSRSRSRMSNAYPSRKPLRRDHRLWSPGRTGTANSVVAWSQVRGGYATGMGTTGLPGQHMAASPHGVPAEMRCLPRYDRRGDLTMNTSRFARSISRLRFGQRHGLHLGFLLLEPKSATSLPPLNQPRWCARVQFNRGQQPQPRHCDCPTGLTTFHTAYSSLPANRPREHDYSAHPPAQ